MTVDERAAREEARRLEAGNPLWIVIFGVYSGEFVCFPRFGLDPGSIVAAKNPGALLPRMRKAEKSVLGIPRHLERQDEQPCPPPSPEETELTHD